MQHFVLFCFFLGFGIFEKECKDSLGRGVLVEGGYIIKFEFPNTPESSLRVYCLGEGNSHRSSISYSSFLLAFFSGSSYYLLNQRVY